MASLGSITSRTDSPCLDLIPEWRRGRRRDRRRYPVRNDPSAWTPPDCDHCSTRWPPLGLLEGQDEVEASRYRNGPLASAHLEREGVGYLGNWVCGEHRRVIMWSGSRVPAARADHGCGPVRGELFVQLVVSDAGRTGQVRNVAQDQLQQLDSAFAIHDVQCPPLWWPVNWRPPPSRGNRPGATAPGYQWGAK